MPAARLLPIHGLALLSVECVAQATNVHVAPGGSLTVAAGSLLDIGIPGVESPLPPSSPPPSPPPSAPAAPPYSLVFGGETCEAWGRTTITQASECETAASALPLSHTTAATNFANQYSSASGCVLSGSCQFELLSGTCNLHLYTEAGAAGRCGGSAGGRPCVCGGSPAVVSTTSGDYFIVYSGASCEDAGYATALDLYDTTDHTGTSTRPSGCAYRTINYDFLNFRSSGTGNCGDDNFFCICSA